MSARSRSLAMALSAGIAAAACADGAGSSDAVVRTDSAGVSIVELSALAAEAEWALEPVWSVSDFRGDQVFDIADVRLVSADRIAVVEGSQGGARIRLLDLDDGSVVSEGGGAGDGPGEFGFPRIAVALGDGRIGVWDSNPRRFTVLGPDLELVETRQAPGLGIAGVPSLHEAEGGLWMWKSSQLGPAAPNEPLRRDDGILAFWSGEEVDTITRSPGLQYLANGSIMGSPPWGTRGLSASHPDGVWLGDTARPEVRRWGREGLRRIVRWPAVPRPRTPEHDDEYLTLVEEAAPPGTPPEVMEQVASMLVVEQLPQWGLLKSSDDGSVWISVAPEMGMPIEIVGSGPERTWVVLDAEGSPDATVRTPVGFSLRDIQGDLVVGVQRDELGRESIRALRTVRD